MAKEIERWITVNGKHIPIYEGESVKEAISRSTSGKKTEKGDTKKKSAAQDDDDEDSGAQDASGRHLTNKEFREQYDPEEAKKAQIEALKKRAQEKHDRVMKETEENADRIHEEAKDIPDDVMDPSKWKRTGQEGGKNREYFEQAKKEGRVDKDAEYEDFVNYAPIKDDPNYTKKRVARETADENDAYDREHKEGRYDIGGNPVYSKEEREALQKQNKERANSEHAKNLVKEFEESNRKFEEQAYGKKESAEPEGRKTYRVHYEDGNQRLLEANSREELDKYLKESEGEYGKATKAEHAAEYDKKDTLKSTDLPFSGKSNTSDKRIASNADGYFIDKKPSGMGDHYSLYYQHPNSGSDGLKFLGDAYGSIDKLESRLGQSVLSNKGVQDVLNQARGGNKESDYIISQNSEGQELKIPRKTYEDRLKRAKEYQENLRGMKGTTPEDHKKAREQVEELENALKTGKSIKIGNKEVGVKKELTPSELEAKARRDSAAEDTRSRRKYMQNIKAGNGTLEDYGNLNYTQSSKLTLGQLKQIAKNAGLEVPGYYNKDDIKRMLQKVWNSK